MTSEDSQKSEEEVQKQEFNVTIEVRKCGESCPFYRSSNYRYVGSHNLETILFDFEKLFKAFNIQKLEASCEAMKDKCPLVHRGGSNFPYLCLLFNVESFSKVFTVKIK